MEKTLSLRGPGTGANLRPDLGKSSTDDDLLLSEKQAADFLQVGKQTLANRRFQGRPPTYVRLGRSIRYRLGDLRSFIAAGRIEPREKDGVE